MACKPTPPVTPPSALVYVRIRFHNTGHWWRDRRRDAGYVATARQLGTRAIGSGRTAVLY